MKWFLLVSFTTFGKKSTKIGSELNWGGLLDGNTAWNWIALNWSELSWWKNFVVGRCSGLSGWGKMKGLYTDVFGPPGEANRARGPWGPYKDEGHWPHHISAKTETRTDNAATHWKLGWPECMGVCVREETLSVCVCTNAMFPSHASDYGEAHLASRARRKSAKSQTGQW